MRVFVYIGLLNTMITIDINKVITEELYILRSLIRHLGDSTKKIPSQYQDQGLTDMLELMALKVDEKLSATIKFSTIF
jgi:hypothetical protein